MFKDIMPEELPYAVEKRMAIFYFMDFARQVPVKKYKLKKIHLWTSFQGLAEDCERIDIIFDLFHQTSIKGN